MNLHAAWQNIVSFVSARQRIFWFTFGPPGKIFAHHFCPRVSCQIFVLATVMPNYRFCKLTHCYHYSVKDSAGRSTACTDVVTVQVLFGMTGHSVTMKKLFLKLRPTRAWFVIQSHCHDFVRLWYMNHYYYWYETKRAFRNWCNPAVWVRVAFRNQVIIIFIDYISYRLAVRFRATIFVSS